MPADVLQMAIDVAGGDYPLAMLTTHNLLKELKYSSTAQGGTGVALVGWFPDSRGTDADALGGGRSGYATRRTDQLIAKLVNLRPAADPLYASDPVGPWYHQFGVFFVAASPRATSYTERLGRKCDALAGPRLASRRLQTSNQHLRRPARGSDLNPRPSPSG